jgi:probable HAF family extracellular repeat protein
MYPVRWSRSGTTWTVERLGTSTGITADINEAGTIVGSSGGNIVLWRRNGSTSSISGARAVALNESETVVGFSSGNVASVWVNSAGLWTPHALPPLAGGGSANEPTDINEDGIVVGFSFDANGVQHAVKWVPSTTTPGEWDAAVPLDSHAGLTNSAALGVDGAAVIGLIWRCTAPGNQSTCTSREPFDWSLGAQAGYGSLGTEDAWPEGLNATHSVVGTHAVRTNRRQELHAFVWSPATPTITDLPAAKGYPESLALDINNPTVTRSTAQVVGRGVTSNGVTAAVVWVLQ